MNVLTVAGTIGKDAEMRYTSAGDSVCNFNIADNQGKDREAIWWNCGLYGKRAESLSKYLVKGQAVTVTGNVMTNKYTDKNGIERIGYNLRVQDVALQGGKRDNDQHKQEGEKPKQNRISEDLDGDCPF